MVCNQCVTHTSSSADTSYILREDTAASWEMSACTPPIRVGLAVDNARGHVYWTDIHPVIGWVSIQSAQGHSTQRGAIYTGHAAVSDIVVAGGVMHWTCGDLSRCGAASAASLGSEVGPVFAAGIVMASSSTLLNVALSASAYAIVRGNASEVLWTGMPLGNNEIPTERLGTVLQGSAVYNSTTSDTNVELKLSSQVRASAVAYSDVNNMLCWAEWKTSSIFVRSQMGVTTLVAGGSCGTPGAATNMELDSWSGWLFWTTATGELRRICAGRKGVQGTLLGCPDSDSAADGNVQVGEPTNGQLLRSGALAVALYRPSPACPFSEAATGVEAATVVEAACSAFLAADNATACAASTECTALVCAHCENYAPGSPVLHGCEGWQSLICPSVEPFTTTDGTPCNFPFTNMSLHNASVIDCAGMQLVAQSLGLSDRAVRPWCYTGTGDGGQWDWCYDYAIDPCRTATTCTTCGATVWQGQGDSAARCTWCDKAYTCAPSINACTQWEYRLALEEPLYWSSTSQFATVTVATARSWISNGNVLATPMAGRTRFECSDFFNVVEYAIDAVYDPFKRYHFDQAVDFGSLAWLDFSAPPVFAASCIYNGSRGLVRV